MAALAGSSGEAPVLIAGRSVGICRALGSTASGRSPGRSPGQLARAVGPDADVVVLEPQPDPVAQARAPRRGPAGSWSRPARSRTAYSSRDDAVVARPRCSSVRRSVSVLVRPSRIATVRWTCSDTSGVVGHDDDRRAELAVDAPQEPEDLASTVTLSSSPVGSSARSDVRVRWPAPRRSPTRCCSPPDSRSGRWSPRSAEADDVEQLAARGARAPPCARRGSSAARRSRPPTGTAAGCGPSAARRSRPPGAGNRSAPRRPMRPRSWPATTARPADGTSRPPRMFSSVRLAAARGADDRDHLARLDEQVQALERDDLEVGDLVDPDEVRRTRSARRRRSAGGGGSASGGSWTRTAGRRSRAGRGGHSNPRRMALAGIARRWRNAPSPIPRAAMAATKSPMAMSWSGPRLTGMSSDDPTSVSSPSPGCTTPNRRSRTRGRRRTR